ncbi:EAL domain-containing protein [Rubrivirga sp.]|uniref:EAL domain-containing protein n=1 Tax=Rubrivirga sp. TaxID=1885344 RepID=UPI003B51C922
MTETPAPDPTPPDAPPADALRRLYDVAPLMMGVVEVHGSDVLQVSDNATTAASTGTPSEATRGRYSSELGVPPETLDLWIRHYRKSQAEGAPVRFRYVDGSRDDAKWLEATVSHVEGDCFTYVVEDVTGRVRQQERLRATEARQGALLRAIPDLIFRLDRDGRYLDVHAPDPAALAAPVEDLLGRTVRDVLPPALARRSIRAVGRAVRSGGVETIEYGLETVDGAERTFEARISPDGDEVLVIVRDVTEQHAVRRAESATAERLRTLIQNLQAAVLVEDEAGRVLVANQHLCDLFGIEATPEALVGLDCDEVTRATAAHFTDAEVALCRIAETLDRRERVLAERVDLADGRILERDYVPITLGGGSGGHLWLYRDVTARVDAERQLREREARYRLLAENTRDLVALHAPDGTYEWVSPSVEALLGYGPADLVGTDPADLLHPTDAGPVHQRPAVDRADGTVSALQRVRHRDGHYVWLETLTQPILGADGAVVRLQTASRDVTDRQEMEDCLFHQAFYDPLTQLPNRALFGIRLEEVIAKGVRGGEFALLYLDLDRFKVVNDTLGHSAGDGLLQAVAGRLRGVARAGDTVARIGGDEFALLIDGLPDEPYAEHVAGRVLEALREPVEVDGRPLFVGASVGVVVGRADHGTPDAVLREADLAMYEAKEAGRGTAAVYDEAVHGKVTDRLRLEMDLRHAVARDELFVVYQPLVRLSDGALTGFEALVRWQHPELGLLAPDAFLGPARDSGQLTAIDRWVLEEACRTAAAWVATRDPGWPPLRVNVNCSGRDLLTPGYADGVLALLGAHGLGPDHVALEITEQVLVEDPAAIVAELGRLQAGGVRVSLDDFGTGYSSLATLHALPVDTVKVDRSFVSEMTAQDRSRQLVETVVHLGRILDKAVVAEGIEDVGQLGALRTVGCAYGQGYLFDRPLPAERAAALAVAEACPWHTHWAVA